MLTLETVRDCVSRLPGTPSLLADIIRSVTPDDHIPTAQIDAAGNLRYSPQFADTYLLSREEVFCLVMHELMHVALAHFFYDSRDKIVHTACDAVINAAISLGFPDLSGHGELFRRYYPAAGMQAVLRPGRFSAGSDRVDHLRGFLGYGSERSVDNSLRRSAGDMIRYMSLNTLPGEVAEIVLIGGHLQGSKEGRRKPHPDAAAVSALLKKIFQQASSSDGAFLTQMMIDVFSASETVPSYILNAYRSRRILGKFMEDRRTERRSVCPVPLQVGRREGTLLGLGVWPGMFHRQSCSRQTGRFGVAVYLDVSGSVFQHLSDLLGVLRPWQSVLREVYVFSTEVVTLPAAAVFSGKFKTSGGTRFECVARHLVDHEIDKAVIITDGLSYLPIGSREALEKTEPKLLTILFGEATSSPFGDFGRELRLTDLTGNSRRHM